MFISGDFECGGGCKHTLVADSTKYSRLGHREPKLDIRSSQRDHQLQDQTVHELAPTPHAAASRDEDPIFYPRFQTSAS
ncbi:hypothetical protein BDN71DRAFT_1453138, partial [Pleurotus eryngii]